MELRKPQMYLPGKKELERLGFETRSEGAKWEYYELWIEGQKLFLTCRPFEKRWELGCVECYPKNELELKIFIRTLIKPAAIEVL